MWYYMPSVLNTEKTQLRSVSVTNFRNMTDEENVYLRDYRDVLYRELKQWTAIRQIYIVFITHGSFRP